MLGRCWRVITHLDEVDHSLLIAAIIGGLGGLVVAALRDLPLWAYQSSASFFSIAVSFLLLRHSVLRNDDDE